MMMMTNLSSIVTWNCIRVYGVKGEPICLNCLSVENYFLLCFFLKSTFSCFVFYCLEECLVICEATIEMDGIDL